MLVVPLIHSVKNRIRTAGAVLAFGSQKVFLFCAYGNTFKKKFDGLGGTRDAFTWGTCSVGASPAWPRFAASPRVRTLPARC